MDGNVQDLKGAKLVAEEGDKVELKI